jgi:Virulence factor membrane-bound polymerase, C-terminal/O-Antigen ligase/Protein glycosylation ligase
MSTFIFSSAIAIAWLSPFAPGPSTAAVPWIVSLLCVGLSLLCAPGLVHTVSLPRKPFIFFIATEALFTIHTLWGGANVEALATLVAWACVGLMACVDMGLGRGRVEHVSARTLAITWLVVALVSVAMALFQYLRVEHWFEPWISHSADGAAFANLRQRNQFATLCGIGLLALLHLLQSTLRKDAVNASVHKNASKASTLSIVSENVLIASGWPWLAITVLAIGNGLSSSRTGALQWLLIAAVVLCWRASLHRKVVQLALGALAIYAVVVALMPWFARLVDNPSNGLWGRASENAGSSSRLWLYSNVLELIAQKPWLGWGWRELGYAHYSTHFDKRFGELLDNAHNLPLHLAVELGVPFALLFCGAVLWWIVRSAPWRETDATRQLAWGVLMLIGVHSMVEYPLWYGPFLMTLGLCIGLLQPVDLRPTNLILNRPASQWNIAGAAIKGVAVCMIAFAGYAAYDYHRVSQIYLDVASRSSLYSDDALGHAQRSVLFQRQARFAELVTTPVTPASAPRVLNLAADLIHFSPEPRVIEALIESATMLHIDDVAMFHLARYKEVYPKDYAAWSALK